MPGNNDKLERFRKQIQDAAERDAQKLLGDAQKKAQSMIDEKNAALERERSSRMLTEVSEFEASERKRVAQSRYSADRKVLLHRNELVNGLFDEIREEIAGFTESAEYSGYLESCVKSADGNTRIDSGVCVLCRKRDTQLVQKVVGAYGAQVKADSGIKLGGLMFRYPARGIYIDLTIDTALEAERESFAANSQMQI